MHSIYKMKNRYITGFLFLLLFSGAVNAQKSPQEIKGDKCFANFAFKNAIEKYNMADKLSLEGMRKVAEAYRKIRNYAEAETAYAKFIAENNYTDDDMYNYAIVLNSNGKYNESEQWFQKFANKNPTDRRSKDYLLNGKNLEKLLKDDGRYALETISINTNHQDFGPAYWGKKLVFASSIESYGPIKRSYSWNEMPYLDVFVADIIENGQLDKPKSLNSHKKDINKKLHEGPAAFARNGTYMAFTRSNYEGMSEENVIKLEIYFSELKEGAWQEEKAFKFNNPQYSVGHPWLSEDGNTMYFTSDMSGGFGEADIYRIERENGGEWGNPVNLGDKVNTEGDEMFPFYHEKKNILIFASSGHIGLGGLDLFMTVSKEGTIQKIMNMGSSINSGYDDFSLIVDPEMKNGYFASNRLGGKGDDDIYKFKILKPFIFTKTIRGRSTDKSGNILPGATISLLDEQGNEVAKTVADESGTYSFTIDADDKVYSLEGNKDRFEKGVSPKVNTEGPEEIYTADVVLNRIPLNLVCELKDQDTNKPLGSVKVKITDKLTGETKEFETSANGDFTELLEGYLENDSMDFVVVLEKEGYESKTVSLEKLRVVNGKVVIKENLVPLKLVVGKDLGELIKINPIYFDYNKYNIRKDAAEELDRIVKVMSDYPELVIELGSHTDCRGTFNYNETLSDNRAKSSAAYIASRISNPERIYGFGYGEKRLKTDCACEGAVKSNCSEENHQKNRRTEFIIVSTTGFTPLNIDSLKQKSGFVNGKTVGDK